MSILARLRQRRFPLTAIASLLVLLSASVAVAIYNEHMAKQQLLREAGAQADLLASAVSGALAFEDQAAAQDYVNAVQVNPSVVAAGVYDAQGRAVARFGRNGEGAPSTEAGRGPSSRFEDGRLVVIRPVEERGQRLGAATIRLLVMPPAQRLGRNAGLLLVLGLAALVVGILAFAQGALRRANRELVASNALLKQQMAEREKAEEALRQSQKMEAIGRLTGGIAHDFNNLLMVASSGVELLERTNDPDKRKKLSEGVKQAVERGAALTRQMLAFSRKAPLKTVVLDLASHLEGLRFLFERSLREDIRVVIDMPPGLWPVEADPGELELALLNLAVNARDAMPGGGTLTFSAHNQTCAEGEDDGVDRVCLTVADTGVGMSEAVTARIFEPFFTTKEVGRGTGLGLSQVYGLARSSGGSISVDSRPGEGAVFTLCLPRTNKLVSAASATTLGSESSLDPIRGQGRLLLVEDDDGVAAGVGHMLRDLGYSYVRAASAADALAVFDEDDTFDMVFSDMVMPGQMDGLQLAEELARRRPSLPIVLTTGYSEAATAAHAKGFAFLTKPYGIHALSVMLDSVMKSARAASADANTKAPRDHSS